MEQMDPDMKNAQAFFRETVQSCFDKNLDKLEDLFDRYLSSHPSITPDDLLTDFQTEGKTLLHIASSAGSWDIVNFLLKRSSRPESLINVPDKKGMTLLINATIAESETIMSTLIDLGANVNSQNNDGATAMLFAAGDGSISRLELLSNAGADFTISSNAGNALHWAAGKGHHKAVKYILGKGLLDVNAPNSTGLPPVIMAAVAASDLTVKHLIEAGANVGYILSGNLTLLHLCAEYGLAQSVGLLLANEEGLKCVSLETNDGNTPILLAAMGGFREVVASLLPYSVSLPSVRTILSELETLPSPLPSSETNPTLVLPVESSVLESLLDKLMSEGQRRMEQWHSEMNDKTEKEKQSSSSTSPSSDLSPPSPTDVAEFSSEPPSEESLQQAEQAKEQGNHFFKEKQYAQALDYYTQAIRLSGGRLSPLWSNRSACHLALKNNDLALRDAEICRKLDPMWPKGCYRLAAARLALRLYEDAAVAAYEGLKIDQQNKELKTMLQLAVKLGQEEHRNKTTGK